MSSPVTIQVKLDGKSAIADTRELNKQVNAAFTSMRESVTKLNAQMRELTFNATGILRGTDQAIHGIDALKTSASQAKREMVGLQDASTEAGNGLKTVGTQAAGADKKLGTLAGSSAATATAFGDMALAADSADTALLALDDGAASASKSVASMGRSAATALTKIDALSGAAFDPTGVVAGADTAVTALDRIKIAAAEVRASLRGASAGSPIFLGGGRRGGSSAAGEERAGTFAGGLRAGASATADVAGSGAALVTIIAAVTGKLSAGFDNMLQGIRGNTTMSNADAAAMRTQTLNLMRTGTPDEQLAQGAKHIANFGYHGQAGAQIANEGNRFGIATHTNVEETDDVLSGIMNAYRHMGPEMVGRVANTVHFAAAGSNMDVGQLEKNSTRTVGLAANYMGPSGLPDVLAAYSALVQHRVNPARADTQVAGMLGQIAAPSNKAVKRAGELGIGDDFNADGLRKENLSGVIEKVRTAIASLPSKEQAAALKDLFNNKQGGIGASFLTGAAHQSYQTALNDPKTGTKAAFAGKVDAIDPAYNAQMKQTQQQFAALAGEIKSDFIPIGERLGPVFTAAIPLIRTTANAVKILLDGFTKLPKPVQEAVLGLGALKLISSFLPMLSGFALMSERTTAVLGGLGKMLFGIGPAAAAGEEGVAGAAAVMSGPFALGILAAVAAAAALALAWKTDFGGIREVAASVASSVRNVVTTQFGGVVKWFQANLPLIKETVKTVLDTIRQIWHDHGQRIMAIVGPMWDLIKQTFVNAIHLVEQVLKLGMDLITGHWRAAGMDIVNIVRTLFSELGVIIVNGSKIVGNAFMLVMSGAYDIVKRAVVGFFDLGKDLVGGIVNGIKSGAGLVSSAAATLAGHAETGARTRLDTHSPSKVMHKIGLDTAEGLAQGIRDGKVSVDAASRMLADTPRAIVQNAITTARRAQSAGRRRAGQTSAAGDFAATVGETPEQKDLHKLNEDRAKGLISAQAYSEAYARIKGNQNKKDESESKRHIEALRQIEDGLKAFTDNPETPSLDKQDAISRQQYRRQIKDLGGDAMGPYAKTQQIGMNDAGTLLKDKLAATQAQRDAKTKADQTSALEEADAAAKQAAATTVQLNRELWQHAGGDMKAYFQSLRDEADASLKAVQDKFGPASAHPNGAAVSSATDQHTAQIAVITQQQVDAQNQLSDQQQQHDLEQGKITLANYVAYLTQRRDAFQQYSSEWLTLDSQIYSTDEEMQKRQLQSIEDLFQAHKISLEAYKKMLGDLATAVPLASSVHQDVVSAQAGAQNKANKGELVGGQDFWDGLASSASENGSRVLTALLHPKDKKSIFKSMWDDLLGSLEGGVTSQLAKLIKNALTGGLSGGGGIGGFFGSLFGGGKKASAAAPASSNTTAWGGTVPSVQFGSGGSGHGLSGNLLGALPQIAAIGKLQGINGAIGGKQSGLDSGLDIASLAASFLPGGSLLAKLFGGKGGGLLGGLGKLFHFSRGGLVPGTGNHDSVPAMLTPGEMVLPKSLSARLQQASVPQVRMPSSGGVFPEGGTTGPRGQSGGAHAEFHNYGDTHYHYEADEQKSQRNLARKLEDLVRGATPA